MDASGRPRDAASQLSPGAPIGRYFVVEVLGAGGMGTVYAAYDPQLERKVALKLMRRTEGADQARLIDEAKALAQVNHPHVTAVYDAGHDRGQVFLTMELVDGDTLDGWLRAAPRRVAEIVEVMVAAGGGLAAAHAAGLVHRDFKPSNVLVDRDGGVKVTDFGLARAVRAAASTRSTPSPTATTGALGTIASLGTPRYMAPEQVRGDPSTAAGDQFAFAVALSEAVYGVPPYRGDTLAELADSYAAAMPPRTSERRVSPRVAAAIARGLALDPTARFATLADLLDALTAAPRRRALWLGAAIATAALGAFAVAQLHAHAAAPVCADAGHDVARAWSSGRAARVAVQFHTSGARSADHLAAQTIDALDHQAADLTAMYVASCRATRQLRTQSDAAFDARSECLDRERAELSAFAGLLEHADRALVHDAFVGTASLDSAARCGTIDARRGDDQPAVQIRPIVQELDGELGAAHALIDTGRNADAVVALEALRARAQPLHYRPLEARIDLVLAKAYYNRDDRDRATDAASAAVYAALATRDDATLFNSCVNLAEFVLERDGVAASQPWLRCARATLERLPGQPEAMASLSVLEAQTADRAGDARAAYTIEQRELGELDAVARPPTLAIVDVLTVLSRQAQEFSDPVQGSRYARRALELDQIQYGDDDLHTAMVRSSLGATLSGAPATAPEAIVQLELARAVFEREFGAASERLSPIEQSLGDAYDVLDRRDDAVAHYEHSIELWRMNGRTTDPGLGIALQGLAATLIRYGRFGEALVDLDQALPIMTAAYGPTHLSLAVCYFERGQALDGAGKPAAAIVELERALPILVQQRADPPSIADVHHALALALWHASRASRAPAEMTAAAAGYAQGGPVAASARAEAERWLAEHP